MIYVCHITQTDTRQHHTVIQNIINNESKSKEHIIKSNQIKSNQIKSNQIYYNDDDNKYYHIKSITSMKYHTERNSRDI